MKKGLLICSGGISTTMIAKKLNELAEGKIEFEAKGVMTDTSWLEYLEDYSLILISPQIRHIYSKIEQDVNGVVPMVQVLPEEFNINDITKCWERIRGQI